ncbi:DUF1439 domain-containing protein [Teredinibacter purpureus]|uniref:DUF1439 domain-containing protein n=1 Tax=Teredinibacter purpureus TaxID=2731756 RepID=UPI0005F81626|nr:DUF1439 domain-containing protein [Teredinibacter purpureus]
MKKVGFLIAFITVVILIGMYIYFSGKNYLIVVPESEIQQKLNTKLPLKKSYFVFFDITLDNPRVDLVEGSDRINAGLDVELNIKIVNEGKPLGGTVDVSGALQYRPEEGAFYLLDPKVENLVMQGLPSELQEKASKVAEKALLTFYSERPLYRLKASDVKQAAAKLTLKNIVVNKEALEITLGL